MERILLQSERELLDASAGAVRTDPDRPRGNSTQHLLVDVLVDRSSGAIAQQLALAQLGVDSHSEVRIVLCSGPARGVERFVDTIAQHQRVLARCIHDGNTVVLVDAVEHDFLVAGVPIEVRAAYSWVAPAARIREAYLNAYDAYRFTRPSPHDLGPYMQVDSVLIDGSRLAGLAALCRLSREDLESVFEVKALDMLVTRHGDHFLLVLEAYAVTGSLRKAAAQVFMHRNSIAYWVQKAEAELGYSITEPTRLAQLFMIVCMYRLWKSEYGDNLALP